MKTGPQALTAPEARVPLSVRDRFQLLMMLPQQGSFATLRIVRELREALSFTEDEHHTYQIKNGEGDRVEWNEPEGLQKPEIAMGPRAYSLIVDTLTTLEKEQRLSMDALDLYERFVSPSGE